MPEQQAKVKVFKKGKIKTREQIEDEARRAEIQMMRVLAEKRPDDFKKIYFEMV